MVLLLLLVCLQAWGAPYILGKVGKELCQHHSHAILTTQTTYHQDPLGDIRVRKVRDLVQCLKCSRRS